MIFYHAMIISYNLRHRIRIGILNVFLSSSNILQYDILSCHDNFTQKSVQTSSMILKHFASQKYISNGTKTFNVFYIIIEVIWHHSRICKCHCVCICNKIFPHKNISRPIKNTWEFKNHRKKMFYHAMFISNKISSIFQNHVHVSNYPCNS